MPDDRQDRPRNERPEYITKGWLLGVAGTIIFLMLGTAGGLFHTRLASMEARVEKNQTVNAEQETKIEVLREGVRAVKEKIEESAREQRARDEETRKKLDELLRRSR